MVNQLKPINRIVVFYNCAEPPHSVLEKRAKELGRKISSVIICEGQYSGVKMELIGILA